MPARVSLAQLLDAPVAVTAADAVAVIVQLSRSPQTGRPLPLQLDPGHVWLDPTGDVTLTPGLLPRLGEFASLLQQMLSPLGDTVPRGLRILADRAVQGGTATMPSMTAFATALAPFQPADPAAAVSALVATLARVVDPPPIPIPVPIPAPVPASRPGIASPAVPPPLPPSLDARPGWRPSRWHVGGAMAALLLSALVGGSLARLRDSGETVAAAGGPVSAVMPEPVPVPTPGSVSEPAPVASTAPPAATPTPSPAPATSDPAPAAEAAEAAARPARLVDRREVDADAVFSPSFASTGTAVFFHAESGGVSALKRADGAAGELRVASIVDDGARNYHVRVSPDGREVAFDSDRDGIRGVYVARADGRGVHRVSGPGYAAVPTWSPDGRRLAFIRGEADRPAVWNLWLLDRATGEQARVTSFRRGQVWGGAWFADGRRLAYSHEDRLILQDLDTGRVREIASPLKGRLVRTPAVSPDGRWIVFQVSRDGVWLLDVERGSMQRVLDDASAEEFAWSPDGRRVAYHSRRSGGWSLWTMAVP